MRFALLCFATLVAVSSAQAQYTVNGRVLDADTKAPVPLVNILVMGTTEGTVTDDDGQFMLPLTEGKHTLRFSALGFITRTIEVTPESSATHTLTVRLKPTVTWHDEVMVQAHAPLTGDLAAPPNKLNATEDLIDRIAGADFLQRANFAWEPVIRGLSGGQIGVVIDGIKVIGACVDKMDPTSAYVEVENLASVELSKGGFDLQHGSQIGGAVNLVTEKPRFDRPFWLNAEAGFESVSALRRVRAAGGASHGRFSVRGSLSYKLSDDFAPGGADPIAHSGYEKNNGKLDLAYRFGQGHQLTASYLTDNAWAIGYPVLLMDATLAAAKIYSLTHTFEPSRHDGTLHRWETRVYRTTVDHWMDDYTRDVTQREVMRGMNMPMYGLTRTTGGLSRADLHLGINRVTLTADAYRTRTFGDMWMFSVFPTIPDMYLLNLGDTDVQHGALVADWSRPLARGLSMRSSIRFDYSWRDVEHPQARAILQGRWSTDELAKTYAFGNASLSLDYALRPATRLRLSFADVGRLPTHVENYGHYVYNYVDGFFYTGNPNLKPERSRQIELGLEHTTVRYALRANVYANQLRNYIMGLPDNGLSGSSTYQFRVYTNADRASLIGGEVSGVLNLGRRWQAASGVAYVRGHNLDLDEPLPLMPPLTARASVRYDMPKGWGELETRMAMPQNRVARIAGTEDGTDGYFVLNLRGSYDLPRGLTLKAGVENVFDTFYHEHLSFGNLPSRGRNVFAALAVSL